MPGQVPFADGPFLGAAFLCERVLFEKDEVLSVIRIVDRINIQVGGVGAVPERMPPVPVNLMALVVLKNGRASGNFELELVPRAPSGLKMPAPRISFFLEGGEDRGVNVPIPISFLAQEQGLYWIDVLLSGERISRIPLRLNYQTATTTNPPRL